MSYLSRIINSANDYMQTEDFSRNVATATAAATLYNALSTPATLASAATSDLINTTTQNAENAFHWVQTYIDPVMFATSDSVLVGFLNAPIKDSGVDSSAVPLLGMCENINISMSNNIVTLKELRGERTILIPGKSQPGSISISRMLAYMPNFMRTVGGYSDKSWRFDMQNTDSKQLFGLFLVFRSSDRTQTLSTLYAERCALQASNISMQAGQSFLLENLNILFDRLVDNCSTTVTEDSGTSSTSTGFALADSLLGAAEVVKSAKAAYTAISSVHSVSTLSRAVDYTQKLSELAGKYAKR